MRSQGSNSVATMRSSWTPAASVASEIGRTRWTIHGERLVDENPHIRLSVASVELPDGTMFEQYVMRMRKCAMTVVLDEAEARILLVWRRRMAL